MEARFADVPERLWKIVESLLPQPQPRPRGGRPPTPNRTILAGIIYRLRTGCQWKALPDRFGSGSTCHGRFQQWCADGVFERVFERLVQFYDRRKRIQWSWTSLDSAIVKAPKGGDLTGPNPTDRAKKGVKRHVLTDGRGVPIGVQISGANVHDKRMAVQTVDAVIVRAPRGPRRPKNICLDKGYDFADVEAAIRARRIRPHIRRRGEKPLLGCVRGKPRRWVVERTNSWHNRFRSLLIRWERKGSNYLGLLHLGCAMIAFQQAT